jgi:hypothetical protein
MKKLLLMIFFIVLPFLIYSDDNIDIERSSFELKLSVDGVNYWQWTVPQSNYVFNENYIQFYPGEALYVEADVINNVIVKLTVVKNIVNESKTIVIEFEQINNKDNPKIHEFMMLKIKNPFNKNLEYKADINLVLFDNKWVNTSTIPVKAGLISYEIWPDIIGTIVLHDFILK